MHVQPLQQGSGANTDEDCLVISVEGYTVIPKLPAFVLQNFIRQKSESSFDVDKIASRCAFADQCRVMNVSELYQGKRFAGWPLLLLMRTTVQVGAVDYRLCLVMLPCGFPGDPGKYEKYVSLMLFVNWDEEYADSDNEDNDSEDGPSQLNRSLSGRSSGSRRVASAYRDDLMVLLNIYIVDARKEKRQNICKYMLYIFYLLFSV